MTYQEFRTIIEKLDNKKDFWDDIIIEFTKPLNIRIGWHKRKETDTFRISRIFQSNSDNFTSPRNIHIYNYSPSNQQRSNDNSDRSYNKKRVTVRA